MGKIGVLVGLLHLCYTFGNKKCHKSLICSTFALWVKYPDPILYPSKKITAKQIKLWGTRIDTAISKKLIPSLNKAHEDAVQLYNVTANSENSNNLNHRFKDLSQITDQAMQQLTKCLKTFETDLTTYINTIEKSEKTTSEKLKKSIDNFSQAISKLSKLKM